MDLMDELVSCKLQLAESEARSISQSEKIRTLKKNLSGLRIDLQTLRQENNSLLDSIAKLSEEKTKLQSQLEATSSLSIPRSHSHEEEPRTPDTFISMEVENTDVEPWTSWQSFSKEKLISMARRGIPSQLRGEIWHKSISNALQLNPSLFNIHIAKLTSENSLIPIDLMRTLVKYQVFQKEEPLHDELRSVLQAFATYRPDIGYIQGMGYLGGMLILHMNCYKSFECLANLILTSDLLRAFYSFDVVTMQGYYKLFEDFMSLQIPAISQLFKLHEILTEVFLLEWIYTLYVRYFPLEVACRIWDMYVVEGDLVVFKVGIAILSYLEDVLIENSSELLDILNSLSPSSIEPEELMKIVNKISISEKTYAETKKKYI